MSDYQSDSLPEIPPDNQLENQLENPPNNPPENKPNNQQDGKNEEGKYSYNSGKYAIVYKSIYYLLSIVSFFLTIALAVINSSDLTKLFGNTGCENANIKGNQNCMGDVEGNSVYCKSLADFLISTCTTNMNTWQDNEGAIKRTTISRNISISIVAISGLQLIIFIILKIFYYKYMFSKYHIKIEIFYAVFQNEKLFTFGIIIFAGVCLGLSQVELNILTNKDFKCNSNIDFIPDKCNDPKISNFYQQKVCDFFTKIFNENCDEKQITGSSFYNKSRLSKDLTIVQVATSGLSFTISLFEQASSIMKEFNLHDSTKKDKEMELEDLKPSNNN